MHHETIVSEFTGQAASFNASAAANDRATLDALVRLAAPHAGERWLETACGSGVISRVLAPHVRAVHGIDMTPTMVDLACAEATSAGLGSVDFAVGDATATGVPDGAFDGAITRFSIHHIPLPIRVVDELARAVRRGGTVVVADHLGDDDAAALGWSQEIERLRDPSHWASLPVAGLRGLGERAGLVFDAEEIVPLEIDFDDWLARGSTGAENGPLIERALQAPPAAATCFAVDARDGGRVLRLQLWMSRWRRPAA